MNKPEYANAYIVSYNQQVNELVIAFSHEYPNMEGVIIEPGKSAQLDSIRQAVCSVTLSENVALQLAASINGGINRPKLENDAKETTASDA